MNAISSPPAPSPSTPPRPLLVLLVDDEPSMVMGLRLLLQRDGYQICTASNGREALAIAEARRPDVIVSDVNMPEMDGWTLVREIRARPHMALTPFIFLTSRDEASDCVKGLGLGADDFISKVRAGDEISARVANCLRHRERLRNVFRMKTALPTRDAAAIRGAIEQFGIATLLSLCAAESKTGVLGVRHANDFASIRLRSGRVVGARVDGVVGLRGDDAIDDIMSWTEGSFEFASRPVVEPDEMNADVTFVLMEAARRADEAQLQPA